MATPVAATPPVYLDGPLPQPRPYSLLESAEAPEITLVENSIRMLAGGAAFWPYPSGPARLWEPCSTGTFANKDLDFDNDANTFGPFGVYLPIGCSTIDATQEELTDRASIALAGVESAAVERQLATGEVNSDSPYLGDSNVTVIAGTHPPQEALALLERAIAVYGNRGVIHADPGIVALWGSLLDQGGSVLRTRGSGTLVVSGAGYLGTEPDGGTAAAATTGWAYASGPLLITRSPVEVYFSIDRSINDAMALAERNYLVTWDVHPQAAVLVDLTA